MSRPASAARVLADVAEPDGQAALGDEAGDQEAPAAEPVAPDPAAAEAARAKAPAADAGAGAAGGIITYLALDGALGAAEFYCRAFGAEIASAMPPDAQGRTMHVHLRINGGSLMLGDVHPAPGEPPKELAGFHLLLPVADVDGWFARALAAGCSPLMPPEDMFWGDRYGQLKDPFGVTWGISGPRLGPPAPRAGEPEGEAFGGLS